MDGSARATLAANQGPSGPRRRRSDGDALGTRDLCQSGGHPSGSRVPRSHSGPKMAPVRSMEALHANKNRNADVEDAEPEQNPERRRPSSGSRTGQNTRCLFPSSWGKCGQYKHHPSANVRNLCVVSRSFMELAPACVNTAGQPPRL